jgi:LemA protein
MNIIIIILVVLVILVIALYNRLVGLRVRTNEAWADIDVQLKRRYDLIPNLVETVKSYAAHERETLDAVVEARAKATQMHVDAGSVSSEEIAAMSNAEAGLTQALGRLMAIAESYPDLKANENFLELQRELTDTENKIQAARRFFNANVRDLNIMVQKFPANIIAGMFGFKAQKFFELDEDSEEREPVTVDFS